MRKDKDKRSNNTDRVIDRNESTKIFFDLESRTWSEYYSEKEDTLFHQDLQVRFNVATQILNKACNSFDGKISVLDVGCGTGEGTSGILRNNVKKFGMDFSTLMVNEAVKRFSHLNCCSADAANIPFRNNSFDIILSLGTLEYIPLYEKAMIELRRVLKDGGAIIFSTPNRASLFRKMHHIERNLTKPIRTARDKICSKNNDNLSVQKEYYHQSWTLKEIEELLINSRFRLVESILVTYGILLPMAESWSFNLIFCRWMNKHLNKRSIISENLAHTVIHYAIAV